MYIVRNSVTGVPVTISGKLVELSSLMAAERFVITLAKNREWLIQKLNNL